MVTLVNVTRRHHNASLEPTLHSYGNELTEVRSVRAQAELEWGWLAMRVRAFHIHQINYISILSGRFWFLITHYAIRKSLFYSVYAEGEKKQLHTLLI